MEITDTTFVTIPALFFLLLMSFMILKLPRRLAIAPLLMTAVLMTIGQMVVIADAKFTFIRIIIFVGWLRIIKNGEAKDFESNSIDRAFVCWVVASVIIGLIPKNPHPNAVMVAPGLVGAFVSRTGFALDALGVYFMSRCFVRNTEDLTFVIHILIGLSVLLAIFMIIEKVSGRNFFSTFGAVPEITGIRMGKLRCQGPFTHPIHAGNFGAILMPLCVGLWFYRKNITAVIGMLAATLVTIASASTGPLLVWISGLLAFTLWRFRDHMRQIRMGLVVTLIVLHLAMKAPIWFLFTRIADIFGGGGYWRAKIIDQFVNHFWEWWLIGTNYTAHWSPTGVGLPLYPDYMDTTNQFVAEGVNGGLLKLSLFIAIIVMCYKRIGAIIHNYQSVTYEEKFMFWALGCTMFSYIVAFMSVSFSAQMSTVYYCLLAIIVPHAALHQAPDQQSGQ